MSKIYGYARVSSKEQHLDRQILRLQEYVEKDLKNEIRWFQEHDIRLMILDLPTSMIQVPKGQEWIIQMVENILIEVLASIAENERNTTRQRQREGIEAAQMKGKHLGRPKLKVPDDFPMVYQQWKENKFTAKEAMRRLEMSPSSFYRVVKKYEITPFDT